MSEEHGARAGRRVAACADELEPAILRAAAKHGWIIATAALCVTAGALLAGLRVTGRLSSFEVRAMIRRILRAAFHDLPPPSARMPPMVPPRFHLWRRAAVILCCLLMLAACQTAPLQEPTASIEGSGVDDGETEHADGSIL